MVKKTPHPQTPKKIDNTNDLLALNDNPIINSSIAVAGNLLKHQIRIY